MSSFESEANFSSSSSAAAVVGEDSAEVGKIAPVEVPMIQIEDALDIVYCPNCGFPPELCSFGVNFDKCVPWIMENMIEALDEEVLSRLLGETSLEDAAVSARCCLSVISHSIF